MIAKMGGRQWNASALFRSSEMFAFLHFFFFFHSASAPFTDAGCHRCLLFRQYWSYFSLLPIIIFFLLFFNLVLFALCCLMSTWRNVRILQQRANNMVAIFNWKVFRFVCLRDPRAYAYTDSILHQWWKWRMSLRHEFFSSTQSTFPFFL